MRKYILLLFALGCFVTSCSDFLETDNRSNVVSDEFYRTETGLKSLTNSTYSSLRRFYTGNGYLFIAGTDIYADGRNLGFSLGRYDFTASESNVKDFYSNCYKGIQLANSVIHYGGIAEDFSQRLQLVDEARFIRAWYYFQLVQQFGAVALNKEMFEGAIMEHSRTDLKTVYQFIIDEFVYLSSDKSNLLTRDNSGVGRANKRAAAFYAAKAYLTRGWLDGTDYESQEDNIAEQKDFENAILYALQAISNEIPTLSIDEAFDINNEDNSELFWSVQYSGESVSDPVGQGSRQQAHFGSYQGGSETPRNKYIDGSFAPSLRLQQMYTKGDGRLEQTFMLEFHESYFDYYTNPNKSKILYYYAPAWATDEDIQKWREDDPYQLKTNTLVAKTVAEGGLSPLTGKVTSYEGRRTEGFGTACIKKFDDYTESSIANKWLNCSMHDVVLARLGEAYLIAAEAYYKKNDMSKAAEMINSLRKRPGTVKQGFESEMSVKADDITIDFILDERARELAGEYVRWTDLKRTHKLIEYVTKYNEDGVLESTMKGPDGKYKILRPIPQDAIDRNEAEIVQNPGY